MRSDPIQFAVANTMANRKPRFVIKIEYDVGSIYLTSHNDITSVPGDVIEAVVERPSAFSQRIYPDEGRSDIGAFTFTIVDKDKQLTESLRSQLQDENAGIRGKKVEFWLGYKGFDFSAFVLFTTQIVTGISYRAGLYTVKCADITREQRQQIFEPVSTTLLATISASDTTILVNDTSKFVRVAHGPSFSDAPSATVGYIRIEDEIIRYADEPSPGSFTGCTRGVFNTRAIEHAVDPNTPTSRRTKVEEFIYLEMPGPKLALCVLTGSHGSIELPEHWHLGIDPDFIREADYEGIGTDLWNPSDDSDPAVLVARFDGLKAQDGKRFLEKELYLLLGCFSPVYADGTLGLRRRVPVISQAAHVVTLTQDNIVSMGELVHDLEGMHNFLQVLWSYDDIQDDFLRKTIFIDTESVERHGKSPRLDYEFRGLHSQRAGDITISNRLDSMRDAYNEPPQRLSATVFGSLNGLEVGDIGRVKVPETILRDFVANPGEYNRAFEIQQRTYDAVSGDVDLQLFGSTSRPITLPFGNNETALPDDFYDSEGTALGSVITITGGTMATGTHTLTGHATLTNAEAIYYYLGDLIIPNGCTINIEENVQLRVMGFLTNNGVINGVGGGLAGVSDPAAVWDEFAQGNPGFIGNCYGRNGIRFQSGGDGIFAGGNAPQNFVRGKYDAFPVISLAVVDGALFGLPDDMRGSGGSHGGRVVESFSGGGTPAIRAAGGPGAPGGAGLCIVCRGMSFGASAEINLDGADPATTSPYNASGDIDLYPGTGAAGGPGAFLLLLDGDTLSVPNITLTNFSAKTGTIAQLGAEEVPTSVALTPGGSYFGPLGFVSQFISAVDHSAAARLIQYIPTEDNPAPDVEKPAAPSSVSLSATGETITARATVTFGQPNDVLEVWSSINNDRTNATRIAWGRATEFTLEYPVLATRFHWFRVRRDFTTRADVFSDWFPASSTGGIQATTLNPNGWTPITTNGGGATMVVNANQIQKSSGVGAFDSQVYSRESFDKGCALSFQAMQTDAFFMVGLNTDPTTDASYTSLDYAWYCFNGGTLQIFESGTQVVANAGSYDTSTVLSITYDGVYVRFLRNGTVVREVYDVGKRFHLDSSWYTPGAAAAGVQFIPLTTATPVAYIARGNCQVSDTNIIKQGGVAAWDSDAYSIVGYPVCNVSFKVNADSISGALMVGLNSDPTSSQSWESLDFALYNNGGTLQIYQSGSLVGSFGSITANTLLAITCDGTNVRYYKDDLTTAIHTAGASGLTLFADMSIHTPGAGINSLRFGPTTNVAIVDTTQIADGAATAVYDSLTASVDVYTSGTTPILVDSIAVPAWPFPTQQIVAAVGSVDLNAASGTQGPVYAEILDTTTSSTIGAGSTTIARNPSSSLLRAQQKYAIKKPFDVPANTAKTYRLYGQGLSISAPGSTALMQGNEFSVEVIKK
jgi:hypothetical protein